jgi:hypothetical protein
MESKSHAVNTLRSIEEVQDPKPNWKPCYFSPFYCGFLIILHVSYIVVVQVLTKRYGQDEDQIALVQSNSTDLDHLNSIFLFSETNIGAYMAWQYILVLVSVCIGLAWEVLDINVKRLEPFYQLTNEEGGRADNALCVDYTHTFFGLRVLYRSLQRRQLTVTASSLAYIFATILGPTFCGGIFGFAWASRTYSRGRTEGLIYDTVYISTVFSVISQVCHGVNILLALYLMVKFLRRRSSLYRNPRGLANLASLVCHSNVLYLFQQIPSYARSDTISEALSPYVFRLRHVTVPHPERETPQRVFQLIVESHDLRIEPRPDPSYKPTITDANSIWLQRRMIWVAYSVFLILFGVTLTAIYYAARMVASSKTANNIEPVAAKVACTFCFTVAARMWQNTQREIHRFEPWRKLSYGHSSRRLYDSLTKSELLSRGVIASTVYGAIKFGFVACWIGLANLTFQMAAVFIPPFVDVGFALGLSLNGPSENTDNSQTPKMLQGSRSWSMVGIGVAIEVLAFVDVIIYMFSGRNKPIMPRRPGTIASEVLYLCRSRRLLSDVQGTSMMKEREAAALVNTAERTCMFGWFWCEENRYFVGVEAFVDPNGYQPFNYTYGPVPGAL